MIATYGRNTPLQRAISAGERALYDNGITLPPDYEAAITAHLNLSPHTFDDDRHAQDWLDIIGFSPQKVTPGVRAQYGIHEHDGNRLAAYRADTVLMSESKPLTEWTLPLTGLDLGAVWENAIAQIGGIDITGGKDLDATIAENARREKLTKQIASLEAKAMKERQPRKKWELAEEIKRLKIELGGTL